MKQNDQKDFRRRKTTAYPSVASPQMSRYLGMNYRRRQT